MKKGKKILLLIVLGLTWFGLTAQTYKFGHLDVNQIFMAMPEFNNIQKILDEETSRLEMQFTIMREELQKLENEYTKNVATYTPQQIQAKEAEYMEMAEKVQNFFTNAQQTIQQRQYDLQMPVLQKLLKAVEAVGDEEGFLYIFQINSERDVVVYRSSKSVDIAPMVKKKLNINL